MILSIEVMINEHECTINVDCSRCRFDGNLLVHAIPLILSAVDMPVYAIMSLLHATCHIYTVSFRYNGHVCF
jgi:hypothetical protein